MGLIFGGTGGDEVAGDAADVVTAPGSLDQASEQPQDALSPHHAAARKNGAPFKRLVAGEPKLTRPKQSFPAVRSSPYARTHDDRNQPPKFRAVSPTMDMGYRVTQTTVKPPMTDDMQEMNLQWMKLKHCGSPLFPCLCRGTLCVTTGPRFPWIL